jgi:hypothetical protein
MIQPHYRFLLQVIAQNYTPKRKEAPLPQKGDQMLYLEAFGASLSLDGARRVTHLDQRSAGGGFVDINLLRPNGTSDILRSSNCYMTAEQAAAVLRDTTMLIGAFLFVNKDVVLAEARDHSLPPSRQAFTAEV